MLAIDRALQDEKFPNCPKLARQLEVTTKTIQRDIDYMRDQLGLPIDYDQAQRGYYYTEKVAAFPNVNISESELMSLLVAGKSLAQHMGTPYEKEHRAAYEKLSAGLAGVMSVEPATMLSAVSFGSTGEAEIMPEVFEPLFRAVTNRNEVTFLYQKPGSSRGGARRLRPYHLAYRDGICYVIGFDLEKNALRQFALTRIMNVAVQKERFSIPPDFSPEAYFKGAFGAQGGDGDYEVAIDFDETAAFYIKERRWHSTQELRELPDGGVELRMRLSDLEAVERWVLGWGEHAMVRAPERLVRRVHTVVSIVAEKYNNRPKPDAQNQLERPFDVSQLNPLNI